MKQNLCILQNGIRLEILVFLNRECDNNRGEKTSLLVESENELVVLNIHVQRPIACRYDLP